MATVAQPREGELAGLALNQAEVLGERGASHLGHGCVPSLRLAAECLCKVVGKGHCCAPHNRILASHRQPPRSTSATVAPTSGIGLIESYALGPAAIQRVDQNRAAFTIFLHEGNQIASKPVSQTAMDAIAGTIIEIGYRHARRNDPLGRLPNVVQQVSVG